MNLTSGERNIIRFSLMQKVQRTEVQTVSTNVEEFFNIHHDRRGRFAPTGESSDSNEPVKVHKEKTVHIAGRDVSLKKIIIGAAVVVAVAGLLIVSYNKAPGSVKFSKAANHANKLEGTLIRGGPELERAKQGLTEKLSKSKNKGEQEQTVRDLAALNGEFLHPDDSAGFIKRLKKTEYSKEELDAMWEYAGLYKVPPDQVAPDESIVAKGPVQRYHSKIRNCQPRCLNNGEKKTMALVTQAINKNSLPRDVTLFRGAIFPKDVAQGMLHLKPGASIVDKIPLFTGLTEARAAPHYNSRHYGPNVGPTDKGNRQVLFVIDAKKGTPAMHSPYGEAVKTHKTLIPIDLGLTKVLKAAPSLTGIANSSHIIRKLNDSAPAVRIPFIDHLNKEEIVLRPKQPLIFKSSHVRKDGVIEIHVTAEK